VDVDASSVAGQPLGGLSQYPCAGARDPCPRGSGFIGDYFGLAVSNANIYALMVSTHCPSDVTVDEGGLGASQRGRGK
jgi:hypothetical protein